jgi:hypothetical protein
MATISQAHASFVQGDLNVVKEERFVFECEWYDAQASLIRKYLLTFYPKDSTAEMVSNFISNHSDSSFAYSTISKTEECSLREWLVQELLSKNYTWDQ